ncbi:hypothetical protein CH375_18925 [Leptospira ellisii]|uniref:Uncharacterized protein n=1 Tax=Leptospira ellisii TaxID=2023197 RepID=A0A2N0BGT9_9LEPT|nr:hypothetical protein CH379_11140 [Leptospira ellisii]PKA03108.1 hypothetical protein CH375_18925 [Leptospira ellisii]
MSKGLQVGNVIMANSPKVKNKHRNLFRNEDFANRTRKKPGGNRAFLVNNLNFNRVLYFTSVFESQTKISNGVET